MYLSATQNFHFVRDPHYAKEWKVKTDAYAYHVFMTDDEAGQLFAWHWHPDLKPGCHVHVGARQGGAAPTIVSTSPRAESHSKRC